MQLSDFEKIKKELQEKYAVLKKRLWDGEKPETIANELLETLSGAGTPLRADLITASSFAIKKFERKMRQDGQTPLVLHSLFLPFILKTFGEERPESFLVAILHDTIEDTMTTFEELKTLQFSSTNEDVPGFVEFLTQDKTVSDTLLSRNAISPKVKKFMEGLVGTPSPVIDVELADRIHDFLDLEYMKALNPDAARLRFANKKERNKTIVSLIIKDRDDLNQNLLEFFWFLCDVVEKPSK